MDKKQDFVYKERDGGGKEIFSMLIYRPAALFLLNRVFKNSNITPNQISFLSLLVIIIGCVFFVITPYPYFLIGFLFLHIGYILDMLDGIYARYKGMSSKYGRWLDPFVDVLKVVSLFSSLSLGSYLRTGNPYVLFWGMIAMANSFVTFYVMNTREHVIKDSGFEITLKGNVYVGYEISLYCVLLLIGLFNAIYPGLIILGTLGALPWIKLYLRLRKRYYAHREEIESG